MMHALMIRLRSAEGAALRTLGLAERRGFRVLSMHLEPEGDDTQRLAMVVSSAGRSVDVLGRQIERLYDVIEVAVGTPVAAEPVQAQQPMAVPMAVGVS